MDGKDYDCMTGLYLERNTAQEQPYTFRNNNPLYYESRDTFAPIDQTQPTEPEESPKAELGEIIANDQKTALESYVRKNLHPETVTSGYSQKILINRWIEADIREIDRRERLAEERYLREAEAMDARWSAENEIKAVQETSSGGYAFGRTIITPNGEMFIPERMNQIRYNIQYYKGGVSEDKDTTRNITQLLIFQLIPGETEDRRAYGIILKGKSGYNSAIDRYEDENMEFLEFLQHLTRDTLSMQIDNYGTKYVTYSAKGGNERPVGTSLIRRLIDSKYICTIEYGDMQLGAEFFEENAGAEPMNKVNAAKVGVGSSTKVTLYATTNPYVKDVNGNIYREEMPMWLLLGHELIHALRFAGGYFKPSTIQGTYYYSTSANSNPRSTNVNAEELDTVGLAYYHNQQLIHAENYVTTENALRAEHAGEVARWRITYGVR